MENKPIRPLSYWCHAILPLIYDDSLSYLEALAKVRYKLNELIEYYNNIKDLIPNEQQAIIDEITTEMNKKLAVVITQIEQKEADAEEQIADAREAAKDDISASVEDDKTALTAWATTEVQRIINEYDSALAPLLNPSATATTLPAGANPTASYSNGVFTFGLPGSAGDMTVNDYGGSAPGIVAAADNALALGGNPPSAYMQKSEYDPDGDGSITNADTAEDANNLGGDPASAYMKKSEYDPDNDGSVENADLAANANNLGGNPPSYYGTAAGVSALDQRVTALESAGSNIELNYTAYPQTTGYDWVVREINQTDVPNPSNLVRFEAWYTEQRGIDCSNATNFTGLFTSNDVVLPVFPIAGAQFEGQDIIAHPIDPANTFGAFGFVCQMKNLNLLTTAAPTFKAASIGALSASTPWIVTVHVMGYYTAS